MVELAVAEINPTPHTLDAVTNTTELKEKTKKRKKKKKPTDSNTINRIVTFSYCSVLFTDTLSFASSNDCDILYMHIECLIYILYIISIVQCG